MPLVTDVAVVLVADRIEVISELVAEAKFCDKAGIFEALLVEDLLGFVPAHDCFQHAVEEATIPNCLVLRAGGDGVGYITKQLQNSQFQK